MTTNILTAQTQSFRECGYDEYWLQEKICETPNILGLGDLQFVQKEKSQSAGGRLDILLKDPEDNSMYEVELMLGDTDESHIIRTIEYWDNEKRKYPQRQHFAVIVAESITRRFFNVIQLLSLNIPIIAIQANILKAGENSILNFTKILDVYEEPSDEESVIVVDEKYWNNMAPWTVQTARVMLDYVTDIFRKVKLNYVKNYVSVSDGNNLFWFDKRSGDKSLMGMHLKEDDLVNKVKELFDQNNISFTYNRWKDFRLTVDKELLEKNKSVFIEIAKLKAKSFVKSSE